MIARNNPFNIRSGSAWRGRCGDRKGFVEFSTLEYGVRAWLILMRNYRVRGFRTIRQIISRFAPPTENDTERYIEFVCYRCFCSDDYEITSDKDYFAIGQAMAAFESSYYLPAERIAGIARQFSIVIASRR